MKRKQMIKYVISILVLLGLILYTVKPLLFQENGNGELFLARIDKELENTVSDENGYQMHRIRYVATILDSRYKNQIIEANDNFEESLGHIKVDVGDRVLLFLELDENSKIQNAFVAGYVRHQYIGVLLFIFALLVIFIGRSKGVNALISLLITVLLVIKVFLPKIILGENPVTISIYVAIIITITTLVIISGFTKKTVAAIVGTISGAILAGALTYAFGHYGKLLGFSSEEIMALNYLPQGTVFNFKGLLFASILLGALGAVMDVSMSIASSIDEMKRIDPLMSISRLFQSGMNVGRDIMGTMINTLILAYTGSSFNIMILILAYNKPLLEVINYDLIVVEIVRSLCGTIGLVATIPFTALIAAWLNGKRVKNIQEN